MNKNVLILLSCLTSISLLDTFAHYDPNAAKWISRDPIQEAGGVNVTAFCRNDPVNNVDPLGLDVNSLSAGAAHIYMPQGGWHGGYWTFPSVSAIHIPGGFDHINGTLYDFPGDMATTVGNIAALGATVAGYYGPPIAVATLGMYAAGPATLSWVSKYGAFLSANRMEVALSTFANAGLSGTATYILSDGDPAATKAAVASGLLTGPFIGSGNVAVRAALLNGTVSRSGAIGLMTAWSASGTLVENTTHQVHENLYAGMELCDAVGAVDGGEQFASGLLGLVYGPVSGLLMVGAQGVGAAGAAQKEVFAQHIRGVGENWLREGVERSVVRQMCIDAGAGARNIQYSTDVMLGVFAGLGSTLAYQKECYGYRWRIGPRPSTSSSGCGSDGGEQFPMFRGRNYVFRVTQEIR